MISLLEALQMTPGQFAYCVATGAAVAAAIIIFLEDAAWRRRDR